MPRRSERQSANLHRLSKAVIKNIKMLRDKKMEVEAYNNLIYCINSYRILRELEIRERVWVYVTVTEIDKGLKDYVKAKTNIDL